MSHKEIVEFALRLNSQAMPAKNDIIEEDNRFYLVEKRLKQMPARDFFYAGSYLGKMNRQDFVPSFILLGLLSRDKNSNSIVIDGKTEWLFICGRDIFRKGIIRLFGSAKKDDLTLVLNEYDECLGLGQYLCDSQKTSCTVVVKNIIDLGDFLRRER